MSLALRTHVYRLRPMIFVSEKRIELIPLPARSRNSDNMVAHGLGTEEQGGISTFVDMLSYRHLPASNLLLSYEDASKYGKHGCTRYYKVRESLSSTVFECTAKLIG